MKATVGKGRKLSRGREIFPEGSEVTLDTLGMARGEFDKLIDKGVLVASGQKKKQQEDVAKDTEVQESE